MNPENIQDLYTLTATQHAVLFRTLNAPDTGVYVEQNAIEVRDLDGDCYLQAWREIMQRHEVFRTAFFWEEMDEPLQIVAKAVPLPLTQFDWRDIDAERQMVQLQELMSAERQRGFDLSDPPLLRLYLIRVAEDRHFILVNHHHILFDDWSNVVVQMEVQAFYNAYRREETAVLPTPTPYREYISWLRQQDESDAQAYWQAYLDGFVEATPIPIGDNMAQAVSSTNSEHAEQSMTLSPDVRQQLQTFLVQESLTYNSFMQAVWAILLNHYSGGNDVLFGTVVHGRPVELPQCEAHW